jgi:2-keto-3-deoxy-L-fuconate dehydrogenase
MMTNRLDGRYAIVTGAAQGIGYAVAQAFLNEGARVIAADIQKVEFESFRGRANLQLATLDATDEKAVHEAAKQFSDVNVVVNCAGAVTTGSILTVAYQDFEHCWQLNVGSVFRMAQAFLPAMVARRSGCVINIASVVSTTRAAPDRCAYAASKGAVIAMTKSIALDVVRYGIRCNSISPGTVLTPSLEERMAASGDREESMQRFIARQPLGRLGAPHEIAAVAVLLASNESGFMTGTDVVVDGGFSL